MITGKIATVPFQNRQDMKIYKVGGAVRDNLLGRSFKDCDWVVVGGSPQEMESLGYRAVGKDFPVFLHPDTQEEYALARTERKTGTGYKGFSFHTSPDVTLEDDLKRRDLTINAMVEDENGELVDPFNGKLDLDAGILRHVSSSFSEDPLRVLRVARFAARFGFTIAEETMTLMRAMCASGELETLVAERVWSETEIALSEKYPTRFLLVLRSCNALEVLFPEIDHLFGIPQPKQHHPEIDTGMHTIMVLNQAARLSDDTQIRFAALVHDLGKGETSEREWPAHHGHEERGAKLINDLCDRYRIPNQYRNLAIIVARHHLDCHRIEEMRAGTILNKLESLDAFRRGERFEQFLLVCEADARGRSGFADRDYPQADYLRKALSAAKQIDTQTLADKGLEGEAMAEAVRLRRIEAISQLRNL